MGEEEDRGGWTWEGVAEIDAVPTTPSLLYGNLVGSTDGLVAYCSGARVSVLRVPAATPVPPGAEGAVQGEQAPLVAAATLQHGGRGVFAMTALVVRAPNDNGGSSGSAVLVTATTRAVEFFLLPAAGSGDARAVPLCATPLTEAPATPFARRMARGLTALPLGPRDVLVLAGTATGVVLAHTIRFPEDGASTPSPVFIVPGPALQTPCSAITCLAVPPPPAGDGGEYGNGNNTRWLCADDEGCICVYERAVTAGTSGTASTGTQPATCTVLGWERVAVFAATGVPCTAAAFVAGLGRGTHVAAAYASGHVRVLSLTTNSVVAEIAAHSRPVTALAAHPHRPLVVSVSEDAWARAWALAPRQPHGIDVAQPWCAFMPYTMWTGVCLLPRAHDPAHCDICCVAYDLPALFAFRARSPS